MPKITQLPTDTAPDGSDLVPFVDVTASRTEAVTVDNLAASTAFSSRYQSTDLVWDDLRVPLTATRVGPLSPPDFAQWRDNGSGSTGVFAYRFDATALEQVYFDAQLPHSYAEGTDVNPHIHYVLPSQPSAGQTLRFGLEYTWANVNGTAPTTSFLYATETFTGTELANTQYIAGFEPDISEPTMKVSAMISCRLFRDATNDTYASDAIVLEVDFHYQVDALGSTSEFTK